MMSDQNKDDQYDNDLDNTIEGDDFSDVEITDEWVDDGNGEFEDEAIDQPQPKKKKSKLTTIIIIAVAVIGVLGFLVMKGGGNTQTPPVAANTQPTNDLAALKDGEDTSISAPQAAAPTPAPAPTEPAAPSQGLMDDPTLLDQPTVTPSAPPALPDSPMTAPAAPTTPEAATPPSLSDAIAPEIKPVSDFPSVDSIKKPDTDNAGSDSTIAEAPATRDAAAPIEAAPTSTPVEETEAYKALQAQLSDKNSQIADLQKSLDATKEDLNTQKSKAAVVPTATPEEITELKSKIADLEDRLAKAAEPTPAPTADEPIVKKVATEPSPEKKIEPVIEKTTAPQASKPLWTLKSASPGRAVISNSAAGDYKTVVVGDTVTGLGKITSITETTSGWIVTGTKGKISE